MGVTSHSGNYAKEKVTPGLIDCMPLTGGTSLCDPVRGEGVEWDADQCRGSFQHTQEWSA